MYDCIVPAAGASARMGSPKPLLPWRGSTMVETVVASALEAGCRVLLVVGCRGAEVAAPFGGRAGRVEIVENPAWELGMTGSIQAALARAEGEAFFVALADMPFLRPSIFAALAAEREARRRSGKPEAAIFASRDGGKGHPVLVPSAWIPDILALDPGLKLRDFMERRPAILVDAGDDSALLDVDTPEDYRRAVELAGLRPGPSLD